MKRKPLLIALGIILLIGGAFTYLYVTKPNNTQNNSTTAPATSTTETETQPQPQQVATSKPGTYTNYNENSIPSTQGTKVLFFHAPWCPQCRQLDASIKAGQIPDNVAIFKVDYDSNQPLRQKYGVTIQTTLVRVDDSGNLVKKYVAYDSPTLQAITPNILQ